MKYVLELRAIPSPDVSIEEKHSRFITSIRGLPNPWGALADVPVPPIGGALNVGVKARAFLGKGIAGDVNYHFRGDLEDEPSSDDFIYLTFNPKKIDFKVLVDEVLPNYVTAFKPYRAGAFDEEVLFVDFDANGGRVANARKSVARLPVVGYLRESFCKAAFGFGSDDAVRRLEGCAEMCRVADDGFYFALTYQPISTGAVLDLTSMATARLKAQA